MNSSTINKMAQMKFYGMQQAYQTLLESNHHHSMSNDEIVSMLVQAEWENRENRKINRYMKAARFRYQASIEEVDFSINRGLDKTHMLRLADCSFIDKKENILISGPTGVGKSYIASALGHQACLQGYKTLYFNTQKLFPQFKMYKADGSYLKQMNKIEKHDLLILDDFGLQPLDESARMILLEMIEDRHGKQSTIISSQLPVSKWYEIIGDNTVADAILDRMVHTAHRLELQGESFRKLKNS